jgi:membrane protein
MKAKEIINVIKLALQEFGKDHASMLGAALAYYAVFSIGPLSIIAIAIAGQIFGEQAARGEIANTIQSFMGPAMAQVVQSLIENAHQPGAGLVATIVGIVGLIFGAMAIFGQLKTALNIIWEVPPPQGGILNLVFSNLLTFLMVLIVVALLLLSMLVNSGLATVGKFVTQNVPGGTFLWQFVGYAVTIALFTLAFAITFRVLPDLVISWKDVWLGALITAVLFILGQVGISIYLSLANVGSAYGAAGSFVALLVWIFYSAQIFFFGAEITQVYASHYGSHPQTRRYAFSLPAFAHRRSSAQAADGADGVADGATDQPEAEEAKRSASPWFS